MPGEGEIRRANGTTQVHRHRPNGLTREKRQRFLDMLAETSNQGVSARAAGVDPRSVQRLRARDATFDRLYRAAIAESRDRLDEKLVARALGATIEDSNPGDEREPVVTEAFDADLALKLAQMHDRRSAAAPRLPRARSPVTQEELDRALLAMIERIVGKEGR